MLRLSPRGFYQARKEQMSHLGASMADGSDSSDSDSSDSDSCDSDSTDGDSCGSASSEGEEEGGKHSCPPDAPPLPSAESLRDAADLPSLVNSTTHTIGVQARHVR